MKRTFILHFVNHDCKAQIWLIRLLNEFSKALVTGGTSGIGLSICEQLVSRGIKVYSVSRNPEKFQSREKYNLLKLDLSDLNAIPEFGNDFVKKFGIPDLIINNAGYGAFFEWKDFPKVDIEKQINTLFTAPLLLCRSFAPIMEDRGSGTIVNITSLATLFPLPYMPNTMQESQLCLRLLNQWN